MYRSGTVAESTRSSAAIVVSVGQVCRDVGTKGSGCSALFQRIYVGHSSFINCGVKDRRDVGKESGNLGGELNRLFMIV